MKNYFQARKLLTPVVILGSSLAFAVACGDDDNNTPSKPTTIKDSSDSSDSSDTRSNKSDDSTSGETSSADDAGTKAPEPVTNDDTGATTDVSTATDDSTKEPVKPGECVENDDACFSCPKTPEQFLKQCSDSECEPFDNNRLGKYDPKKPLPKP
jgi:hypothetical protein